MGLSSKALKLATIASRPSLLTSRTKHLFILSHMRSRSSLLAHILGSNEAICGYSELHQSYLNPLDTLRMRLRLYQELKCDIDRKYLLDKILHDKHRITKRGLGSSAPKMIVLYREPGSSLRSLIAMGRTTGRHEHSDPSMAVEYYCSRLACLANYAARFREHCFFLESDDLVGDTDRVLRELTEWLGLDSPLTARYRCFSHTGKPSHGDPSTNIRAGTVVATDGHPTIEISPNVLESAKASYQAFLQELSLS